MSISGYGYPDTDDKLTTRFIEEAEPYTGYWDISDQRAMARTADYLTGLLGPREETRALDVGCGLGRLLPWLAGLAGHVTAIDPDPDRRAAASRRAAGLANTCDITIADVSIAELNAEPFDLVLCSHVIQHIPTTDLVPLLRRLHGVTAPDGALVLIYTRSPVGGERYSIDRDENGRVRSHPVDREQFDAMLASGAIDEGLPIHHRDPIQLANTGAPIGWAERWSWTYHVMEDLGLLDAQLDRDIVVNGSSDLHRLFGRDMVAVWQRQ